jgi:hypothetical protein
MQLRFYLLLPFLLLSNSIMHAQTKGGWRPLFNGKTLEGWKNAQHDSLPEKSWSVENGELTFDPLKGHGSDITTTRSLLPNTSLGCEFQIIDDNKHPDAKLGVNGNRKTGALYDILPADLKKIYKPAGEWNTARIVVKGNHAEHWLNGLKIIAYERDSEAFKEAIAKSKFNTTHGFAEAVSSPILLQAHGDKVAFRNIKIKEFR